jgi:hypothetical protein
MLTYLTSKGLSDAQIQLISGHESKKSLEVYQHRHSNRSIRRTRMRSRAWGSKSKGISVGLTYLCWANPGLGNQDDASVVKVFES